MVIIKDFAHLVICTSRISKSDLPTRIGKLAFKIDLRRGEGRKFNFSLISLKNGQTLEKVSLFRVRFSCERDRQSNFKFEINSEVLFIYRLIPRAFGFLRWFAALGATPN
jgi:hypothetical protein